VLEFDVWENERDTAEHSFFQLVIAVEKFRGCKLPDVV
jgi:hypothetical protein